MFTQWLTEGSSLKRAHSTAESCGKLLRVTILHIDKDEEKDYRILEL